MLAEDDESASMLEETKVAKVRDTATVSGEEEPAKFERGLVAAWNPREWCDAHTVLAVSGGADSVALLRAMAALKAKSGGKGLLVVAHLDHQLRDEAKADADWLARLCLRLGLPLEIGFADVPAHAAEQGDGLESAGRSSRYEFLRQTAERLGARFVVTGHTADDQAETVLHRIVRGTGLAGLAGMPSRRRLAESVTLVRPMLSMTRSEVLGYLAVLGQDYRTDESNLDTAFTRNRVRHQLLPELREYFNPEVGAALVRLSAQASETQQMLEILAARLAPECVAVGRGHSTHGACRDEVSNAGIQIECVLLGEQPEVLIREVCKLAWREAGWPMQAMGFREWQLLSQMVIGQHWTANLPGNVRARRQGDRLLLERGSLS